MQPQARRRSLDAATALAFLAISLLLCLHLSRGRLFWSDEIFAWMLVHDPSLPHMLAAWRAGADGGGLCFYLLARAWLHLFGASELTFRLFSATGTGLAAALTFLLLRRFVRWHLAAATVALLWWSSDTVLWQLMQARFYGLLLATVAAATLLFALGTATRKPTPTILCLTFLTHTLLVGTHPFGIVYSAALVTAMLLVAARRRTVPSLALAAAAGWAILIPSLTALRNSAAVGKPHFWIPEPTPADLIAAYTCWSLPVAIALGVSLTALLLIPRSRRPRLAPTPRALRIAAALLLTIPTAVWLESLGPHPLFVDRYLVPVVIPTALVLARILRRLDAAARSRPSRTLLATATLALLAWTAQIAWVQYPSYAAFPASHDTTAAVIDALPRNLPIVVEPLDLFARLALYRTAPGLTFRHVLDWQEATRPDALRGEVSGFHEMENWRKVGYFPGSILDSTTLLAHPTTFVVIDVPTLFWFEHRIQHNPAFTTQLLRQLRLPDGTDVRIWLVHPAPAHS